MPLLWRLTLSLGLVLAVMLVSLGVTLLAVIERDFQRDFVRDLEATARLQAGLSLRPDGLSLTRLPGAAFGDLGETEAFLLRLDGSLVESLAGGQGHSSVPRIPTALMTRIRAGQTLSVIEGERRAGFWEFLQPQMQVHTRLAVHPIYSVQTGRYEVTYLLVLRARDEGTVAALMRVRNQVVAWLIGGLLVSAAAGFLLARVIAAPVQDMARVARRVEGGDLNARMPAVTRRDELGLLSRHLNAMLDRLQALMQAQRRFTADAAHDLRTPIAVLRGEVELALRRERPAQEYRETLERMGSDLNGLSTLTEDLLTLARLESGEREAEATTRTTPLPLMTVQEVLQVPLQTALPLARQQGLTLQVDVPPGLVLQGDAPLLSRALLNLLTNALLHGGNAVLRARSTTDHCEFDIQDDGPGVPEHLRSGLLFNRFSRGKAGSGSGLGLAIAREVARFHGGTLTYAGPPQSPSTFTLTVPLRPAGGEA